MIFKLTYKGIRMNDNEIISSIAKKASAVLEDKTGTLIEPLQFIMDLDAYNKERPLAFKAIYSLINDDSKQSYAILELLKLSAAIDKTFNFGENEDDPMVSLGKEYGRVNEGFTSPFEAGAYKVTINE